MAKVVENVVLAPHLPVCRDIDARFDLSFDSVLGGNSEPGLKLPSGKGRGVVGGRVRVLEPIPDRDKVWLGKGADRRGMQLDVFLQLCV